jgi:hypothetical protein
MGPRPRFFDACCQRQTTREARNTTRRKRPAPHHLVHPTLPPSGRRSSRLLSLQAKEHERKQRRIAKKNPFMRKKLRKDPGIPNLNPFKAQILKKLADTKKLLQFNEDMRRRRQAELVRALSAFDPAMHTTAHVHLANVGGVFFFFS